MSRALESISRASVRCARPTCCLPLQLRCLSATATRSFATASPNEVASTTGSSSIPLSTSSSPSSTPSGEPLPFRVGRSLSLSFPVYHRIKSGGTNRTTEVKKIEGDARALSKQLTDELSLETKINPRTNHIIIKGFHREKVITWLTERGL